MKKMTLTFILILALTMVAWAADPYANLSSMELEHLGLNLPNGEIAPPYSPGGAVDNITWVAEPNCLNTINRAACGKVGNYVYIFGGQGSGSGATHVAFNITTELWELSTAPGVGGSNWSCAAANGALYVFPRSFGNSEVQKFVPDSTGPLGTWSLVALYPINSWANAIAWDGGNYIYCAGGSASTPLPSMVDSVYRFDLTTNTFESLAPLPESRGYVGGAFVNGKFYVLGGDNLAYQYTSTCYEYSPATNTWAVKAPMIKASAFNCFNTVTDGDLIYLVGGGGGNATSLPSTDTVQVYNPATDTWSIETSRMNNYGTNAAAYVPEGNWIFDCGGRILTVSYNVTWRGNLTAPQPPISITLLPVNPPINIPAQGGSFDWDITLHNNESTPQTFDVWTIITLPNGSTRPGWGPFMNLTMPAGATINRVRSQNIVDRYPPGDYTYTGNVGDHPGSVWDSDSFPFTKLLGGDGGWAGERAYDGQGSKLTPAKYFMHGATPNPFNPTTTLSFAMPQAGPVKLSVYSVSGRQVATLVNGWRDAGSHEVTFDGSGLASGLYVYQLTAGDFHAIGKMVLTK